MQQETYPLGLNRNMIWKRTSKLKTEEDLYGLRMKTLKNSDDFFKIYQQRGSWQYKVYQKENWQLTYLNSLWHFKRI